eukprot:CAMPEP_0114587018 /NCGR_PEP_ID=MMETSP0125-20121206/10094_1 /TAXON_ID=485358 ORGANISM="Aristerostoma sp., Strain ATCC 50986" /NCGR_SAMPLE_ID=MMETSP0125 /ASSEMBLY_ACC=CAM_ASM_000245 /LENGTH=42 /DNA_ID= /DNA_START= /DNA_END= /DNA_ORIENTATION=
MAYDDEKKKLKQTIAMIFETADMNGDGVLTQKELYQAAIDNK